MMRRIADSRQRADETEDLSQSKTTWHIITCEYPPQLGGVSQYSYLIAAGLAVAGDLVHVWRPATGETAVEASGVISHSDLGRMSPRALRRVGALLDQFPAPRRLLVQWVPHGYGYRSMNLPFCWWLLRRARRAGDHIELMVHEAYLPFKGSWKQYIAAAVHRVMTMILLRAPSRIWISIPAWEDRLRPYALGRQIPIRWLPLPSNIPEDPDLRAVAALHARYTRLNGALIGHFGTYDKSIVKLLVPSLRILLHKHPQLTVLLIGPRGDVVRQALADEGRASERIFATGALSFEQCAEHLKACDILLQPYPDGVSSRRTSLMAGLAMGSPIVTTAGEHTEPFWGECQAVRLTPTDDAYAIASAVEALIDSPGERRRLGRSGNALYEERFRLSRVISMLREP
jgi:glycosyltransferase involved in cell wall biosynthesis